MDEIINAEIDKNKRSEMSIDEQYAEIVNHKKIICNFHMNILTIEDDERVAELIQRGLEEHGFSTELAVDGLFRKDISHKQIL